jgi:S1-C subfamily serine protease
VAGAVMAAYIAHLAHPATDDVARPLVRVTAASTLLTVVPSTAAPTSAMPGVVQLLLPLGSGRSGTAAAVGDGQLVTSAELVDGVTTVTAVMADGTEQPATVVWVDAESGTAVLEIGEPTPTLASGRAATLNPGDTVTAAGTNIPGEVLAVGVKAEGRDGSRMEHLMRLRMDAPVENGAVLLDDDGNAVGICVGHEDADESTALAAPIELAKAATGGTSDDGTRQFAWLGMTGKSVAVDEAPAPATSTTLVVTTTAVPSSTTAPSTSVVSSSTAAPPTAQPESTPPTTPLPPQRPEQGAQVVAIDPDGAAALGGLRPDDIVIAVDDVPVSSMNALILLVRERKVGDAIHLTVVRGGETVELEAVLKDRPAADAP